MDKPQTYRIDSDRWPFIQQILFELNAIGGYEVTFTKASESKRRTNAQSAIRWIWHKEYCSHFGLEDEEESAEHLWNYKFRYMFVRPILLAKEGDMFDYMREQHSEAESQAAMGDSRMMRQMCKVVFRTNWLDVKEMSEALDRYDRWTAQKGYSFQARGKMYDEAMGR